MAAIYPNRKDGKIVSLKFKAFLGRDENGKQIFKRRTWTPEKAVAENKLMAQAEKEATIWEHQINDELAAKKLSLTPKRLYGIITTLPNTSLTTL